MMAPHPKPPPPPPGLVDSFVDLADRVGVGLVVSRHQSNRVHGTIVYANLAAGRLLGIAARELIDQTLDATRIAGASFAYGDWSESQAQDPPTEARGEMTREDGQRIFVRWSRVKSETADSAVVVHFLAPIERVARTEQALHDSEQRFRRLIDIAPDGVLVLVGTRIVYANQAITRIHGYSNPRQLSHLGLEHLFCNEDRQVVEQTLALAPPHQTLQLRAIRRDGSMAPVEAVLLQTEWDESPAVLIAVRDLAGRRLIQSQLVHTDRLAAVGTLAAGVAHEINNPLAYVLLNLQYLIRELPKLSANQDRLPHLVERLREARHGAERVVAIVKDLRAFSRIDEDQMGQVDLRRVLLGAIKVAKTQLMECGQIIERFEDVRPAFGNAPRLEQVFLNLLMNAIQSFSSVRADTNRIFVRMRQERRTSHEFVVVEVTDNGSGIAPEHLNRIFDPFFTTKPVGLGTGLGLPICHSIVTRMGGEIEVKSAVGQGTTAVVSLPVAAPAPMEFVYRPSPTPSYRLGQRARILVVDDEMAVATMLSRFLGEEHDVQTASSAEAALRLMDDVAFDIVFCDLLMPSMTGMDLYTEVARRYPGREQQILFMTGGAFTPRAAQFLARVSNPRLEKPFDLRAVRGLVRELLARANTSRG